MLDLAVLPRGSVIMQKDKIYLFILVIKEWIYLSLILFSFLRFLFNVPLQGPGPIGPQR